MSCVRPTFSAASGLLAAFALSACGSSESSARPSTPSVTSTPSTPSTPPVSAGPPSSSSVSNPPVTTTPATTTPAKSSTSTHAPVAEKGCGKLVVRPQENKIEPRGKTRYLPITVRNAGGVPCPIDRYPAVVLTDSAGQAFEAPVDRAPARVAGPAVRVIRAGKTVRFEIAWSSVPSSPSADPKTDCLSPGGIVVSFGHRASILASLRGVTACDGAAITLYPFQAVG